MKCKYTFPIEGHLRFSMGINFSLGNRLYQFDVKENLLSSLSVTISSFPEVYLPKITLRKEGEVKASISVPRDPNWEDLVSDIRTIEGALCIWGVREINVEDCATEWIPESDLEKEKVDLFSFSRSRGKRPASELPEAPLDLYVRSVLAASDLKILETPLNFFRRGIIDIFEQRYIDAIYNFYFVFETLFANGTFKKNQVISEFLSSAILCDAIENFKKNPDFYLLAGHNISSQDFAKTYGQKNKEQIIEHIVDLRGFLHHHTCDRKDIWHPAKQRKYAMDALALLSICQQILSARVSGVLFSENKITEFLNTIVKSDKGQTINWHPS
jgi:hypothetical protein